MPDPEYLAAAVAMRSRSARDMGSVGSTMRSRLRHVSASRASSRRVSASSRDLSSSWRLSGAIAACARAAQRGGQRMGGKRDWVRARSRARSGRDAETDLDRKVDARSHERVDFVGREHVP